MMSRFFCTIFLGFDDPIVTAGSIVLPVDKWLITWWLIVVWIFRTYCCVSEFEGLVLLPRSEELIFILVQFFCLNRRFWSFFSEDRDYGLRRGGSWHIIFGTILWTRVSGDRGLSPWYLIMSDVWLSHSPSRYQRGCSGCSRTWCMDSCVTVFGSSTQEIWVILCGAVNRLGRVLSTSISLSSFSSLSCVFDVNNLYTLRGFYELTQAWSIISVSVPHILLYNRGHISCTRFCTWSQLLPFPWWVRDPSTHLRAKAIPRAWVGTLRRPGTGPVTSGYAPIIPGIRST